MGKVKFHYLHTLKDLRNMRAENPIIRSFSPTRLAPSLQRSGETNSVVHGNMFLGRIPAQNSSRSHCIPITSLGNVLPVCETWREKGEKWEGGPWGLMLGITEAEQEGLHPPSVVFLSRILLGWLQDPATQEWWESSLAGGIQGVEFRPTRKWVQGSQLNHRGANGGDTLGGQGPESRGSESDRSSKSELQTDSSEGSFLLVSSASCIWAQVPSRLIRIRSSENCRWVLYRNKAGQKHSIYLYVCIKF